MKLLRRILRTALARPRRVAVVDDQRSWRAFELVVGALHLAKRLDAATSAPRIGVMLPTSGLFPMTTLAAWLLGRTVVPLNYLLSRDELEYVIKDAELDVVVTVGPMLQHVLGGEAGGGAGGGVGASAGLPAGVQAIKLEELSFKGLPPLRWPTRRPEEFEAVILYTSGTSGRPKGVMLTAANLLANIEQCTEWAGFTRRDVMLGVLPQFHSFGLTVLTLMPLAVGCRAIYTARFVPRRLVALLREHRPTAIIAIPSMYNALRLVKDAEPADFASLRYVVSGGEPLPDAVFEGFRERFGLTINEGYGLTETSPVTHWCRPHEQRRKSVGKALPRVETRIVGPDGSLLGPGEDGEIRLRGPNVMKGYFKLPEQTAAVFDEAGFFKTGDMGRVDPEGFLSITGRIKEMLIIGGENVFPREIEEALNQHPSVKDSAVIGVMDESRGEVPLAFVELKEDAQFDEAALRSHCRLKLAGYKVPKEIRRVDALPRNGTGKIVRRALKP